MASAVVSAAPPRAPSSWGSELKAYERERRREVDVRLVQGPPPRLDNGTVQHRAREYDTVLQRFRDDGKEARQRDAEEGTRLAHLNRARDMQLRREHHYDIINHEGRLEPLRGHAESFHPDVTDNHGNPPIPTTYVDYNIISNIPHDAHHWDHPEHRPLPKERGARRRFVPHSNIKDFNIISNRYVRDHEVKTHRDRTLNLLEATEKFKRRNRFDPLTQRLTDPQAEANLQAAEHARQVDQVLRTQSLEPPSHRLRESDSYNLITHEVTDEAMLRMLDVAQESRTARYKTKHSLDHTIRAQDHLMEDAAALQKHTQVAHQRFEEVARRGHDIITNCEFGEGPKRQALHQPYTTPHQSAWEKTQTIRDDIGFGAAVGSSATPGFAAGATMGATMRLPFTSTLTSAGSTPRGQQRVSGMTGIGSARGSSTGVTASRSRSLAGASSRPPNSARAALAGGAPPAPLVPGTPAGGSVYSRPRS